MEYVAPMSFSICYRNGCVACFFRVSLRMQARVVMDDSRTIVVVAGGGGNSALFAAENLRVVRARIERVARDRSLEGQLCSRCRRERWLFHVRLRRGIPEIGEAGRNLCL